MRNFLIRALGGVTRDQYDSLMELNNVAHREARRLRDRAVKAEIQLDEARTSYEAAFTDLTATQRDLSDTRNALESARLRNADKERADRFAAALARIAELETPKANGTVRKMARIARDAIDGWTEWNGGACPVSADTRVEVRFRSGVTDLSPAPMVFYWGHDNESYDIVAYRVIEPTGPSAKDGWTEWNGGECPVDPLTPVEIVFRNGNKRAGNTAGVWLWKHTGSSYDIVAYRVIEPTAAKAEAAE